MCETVVIRIEPSKRLSEILGVPYFIERRFTTKELLKQGVISEDDIEQMKQGKEIRKQIEVSKS